MKLTPGQLQLLHIFFMVVIAFALWNTIVIYPIKLLVVMFHEMSHGLMAMAFGGQIIEIQIDQNVGGYCLYTTTAGFWGKFMTASAGYLGSLLWGMLILILAIKTARDKYITLAIGCILLILSWFVIQSGELFGIGITIGTGLFMLLAYRFLGEFFHDLFLKFIGVISCVYVIWDIKDDLIDRTNIGSDADALAALTGLSSIGIGIAWMITAVAILFLTLRFVYRQQEIKI